MPVASHQFGIVTDERTWPTVLAPGSNGLVDPVGGGALIRTGIASGVAIVDVEVRALPPSSVEIEPWDEIVEISLVVDDPRSTQPDDPLSRFQSGSPGHAMRIGALMADAPALPPLNPAGPGPYRIRVHARGRDHNIDGVDFEPIEEYLVVAWPGPIGPETAHKQTDRYGAGFRVSADRGP